MIAVVIGALLLFVVLPVGGLVVIGLGVYVGVLARRAGAGSESLTDATPARPAARKFPGLKASYGLSAALTVVGILMFIGGIALFSAPNAPDNRIATPSRAPTAPVALPTSEPAFATPPVGSVPTNRQVQPIQAPAENTVQPQPAAPLPATSRPAARPQPALPKPVATQPALPQPVATQPNSPEPAAAPPASPPPAAGDGGAVYYKNCDEARAAGVAPLHRGQPGYRAGLDRDKDGIACDSER